MKTYHQVSGAVFVLVALVQLARIVLGWTVVIDGWTAPMWISWIAVIVTGGLAVTSFSLISKTRGADRP